MSARPGRLAALLLFAVAPASCGRVGYDLVDVLGRSSHAGGSTGGATSGPDSGTMASGGGGSSSSGGGAGTAVMDSGLSGNGGRGFSGASSGGASDATTPDGSGGASTVPPDAGGSAGSVGSGGMLGGGDAGVVGCADGQREGFLDLTRYPDIAACAGGFAVPGVIGLSAPVCGRTAGDDGANPDGTGCNALDLCAVGFHVCSSSAEVSLKSPTGCTGAAVGTAPVFYITAQTANGSRVCAPTGSDDVFGCGTLGSRPVNNSNCAPLDRWSTNLCAALTAPWACGSDQAAEAAHVAKPGWSAGGVLCCHD